MYEKICNNNIIIINEFIEIILHYYELWRYNIIKNCRATFIPTFYYKDTIPLN